MTKYAKDLMSAPVLTVGPDTPLADVNRMFVEDELHGAPVVSDGGVLLGFLSALDLLRTVDEERELSPEPRSYFQETLEVARPFSGTAPVDLQDRLAKHRVADAMQTKVFTVPEDAPISEIAQLFRDARIHRAIVMRNESPVGLISSFDLLALLEEV